MLDGAVQRQFPALVLVGPSGVGKSTLVSRLLACSPLFELSVSLTTRAPRPGEVEGKDYCFVSDEDFRREIQKNTFAQYCEVHGKLYGTNRVYLDRIVASGKICLLDVDIQGAQKIQKLYPGFSYYFIEPPSMQELEQRLRGRKTDSEEKVLLRLKNARQEIEHGREAGFFKVIVNNEIEETFRQLKDNISKDLSLSL